MTDKLEICRAWRRLMLTDDGQLIPDAEAVMRDLEQMCGWMRSDVPVDNNGMTDPYRATAALAKRGVFAQVKKRLFSDLRPLQRMDKDD